MLPIEILVEVDIDVANRFTQFCTKLVFFAAKNSNDFEFTALTITDYEV